MTLLFLAKAAEREDRFAWNRPFQKGTDKLIRRHPHIFEKTQQLSTQEIERQWNAIKEQEAVHQDRKNRFDEISRSLPALAMIQKLLHKVKRIPDLSQQTTVLISEQREDQEEEIGRRIAKIILEADQEGIQAEGAVRKFFLACCNSLVEGE